MNWTIIFILGSVGVGCIFILFALDKNKNQFEERAQDAQGGKEADLVNALHSEISRLPISSTKAAQVTKSLSVLVDKEVHKKAAFISQEVGKQYAQMLDEKDKKLKHVEEKFEVATQKLDTVNKNYKKVRQEKKQTEAVVRSIAEGLIVVNEKGETLLMNPAAEKLLGVKREEAIGRSILNSAKEEQLITMASPVAGTEEREIMLNSQNESTKKILRASTAVIENEAGQTMGMVSVLTDVTKQKELEEMKNKFVSNVTHELRTPLAAIKESVNLFLDNLIGNMTPEQEKVLQIAKRNIQRLSRLIDDVLDISKLEAGKAELNLTSFRLDDFLKQNVGSFDAWARTKLITLETKLPDSLLELEADQDKLSQILTNLIGNAMKFTPQGGKITIEVKQIPLAPDNPVAALEIGVQDTGPGISETDQKKIFQKFAQGSAKSVDKIRGTGLGLAISKEIAELHGGRIWVASEEGVGARFAFAVPQKCALAQPSVGNP